MGNALVQRAEVCGLVRRDEGIERGAKMLVHAQPDDRQPEACSEPPLLGASGRARARLAAPSQMQRGMLAQRQGESECSTG